MDTTKEDVMLKTLNAVLSVTLLIGLNAWAGPEKKAPETDLFMAVITGDLGGVQQHIEAGSDLNITEPTRGSNPLMTAALLGKTDIALALIDGGADIDTQNFEGSTALITAAFFCRTEIVKAQLDKGADKSLKNRAGRTALDAVSRPFEEAKDTYDKLGAAMAPLGLVLDYERIKTERPVIAELLQQE